MNARVDSRRDCPDQPPKVIARDELEHGLQTIVQRAAEQLRAPTALVSVVVDGVQFFKAHHTLQDGTSPARDETSLDARPQNSTSPYDVRAYLGVPIRSADATIGTLCVLDIQERSFTSEDLGRLEELAGEVTERLTQQRKPKDKLHDVARPAMTESRRLLTAMELHLASARLALADLSPLVRWAWSQREKMVGALARAAQAYPELLATLSDLDEIARRLETQHGALQSLLSKPARTTIGDVLETAQALSVQELRQVGGAEAELTHDDQSIATPRATAVATLTSLLTTLARSLRSEGCMPGIKLTMRGDSDRITVSILPLPADTTAISNAVKRSVPWDPTLQATFGVDGLHVTFQRDTS